MQIRLNKFLAQAGVASRREVDKMIAEGRIKVNGQVVKTLGSKIDDEKDKVEVEGRRVEREEGLIYLMKR
jgi:23S rRNA pseudouridine2605 synthase